MSLRTHRAPLLLTDATVPVNFCKAGIPAARAMAEFLSDRLHMVSEVHEELEDQVEKGLASLGSLLADWPPHPPRDIGVGLRVDVATVLAARQIPGGHAQEDEGEVATVLYAAEQRANGEEFLVLTDDRFGKDLARDRRLDVVDSPGLVVEMVGAEALNYKDGERVWRECLPRGAWPGYRERVKKECPNRLP